MKRIYWGIRVLPVGILNLDYDSPAEQWNTTESQQEQSGSNRYGRHVLLYTVRFEFTSWAPLICDMSVMVVLFTPQLLIGLSISAVGAGLILLGFYLLQKRIGFHHNQGG